MFIFVILVFVFIAFLEIVPLYKKGYKKELVLYSCIFCTGFVILLLSSLKVELPDPVIGMDKMLDKLIGFFSS